MPMKKGFGWLLVLLFAVSVTGVARTTMVTVSINDDAPYTAAREVDIHLVYTGNEAPTQMRVYGTGEDDWSEWFDYTDELSWVLAGDDGRKTIKVETRYWLESGTDATVYGAWRIVTDEDDIFLDMTPPVLTASVTPDANENGWYNGPVSVVFQANDAGSGLAASPDDFTLDQEGAGQSVVGKAVDKAGNEAVVTVNGINIDLTPPVLTVFVTPDANKNGWHNEPVLVVFQANDAGSGLAVPVDVTLLDQEGAGQSVETKVVDKAGNEAEATVSDINIDLTPPVLTVSVTPDPNENGWHNGPVSIDYTATDSLSGIASAVEDKTFGLTADVTLFPKATDKAGNVVSLPDFVIHIDVDDPSIAITGVDPGASPDVWIPGPVTVAVSGDAFSGVASIEYVEGTEVLAIDGGEQIVTAQVTNLAGKMSEISVGHINIDGTLPTTTILLLDSEVISGADVHYPASATIDLKGKLDAFGTYDLDDVALGYAFENALGAPIAGLTVYATLLEVGTAGVADVLQSLQLCGFAPAGGFYYFVLPAKLVSGQVYEIWFEETTGLHTFKTQVIAP